MKRFASTRSLKRASQPGAGLAQCSVGSIDDDGIRYGLTTHALSANTIRIAPAIVSTQSSTTRTAARQAREETAERVLSPHALPAPGLDLRVVAGEQDVRHLPAAELGRPRVVRVLEAAAELLGEALELAGALGERARAAAARPRRGAPSPAGRRSRARTGRSRSRRSRDARRCARRSPRSAPRGASACSSCASSSTIACVSGRPCGVSAITRRGRSSP